MKSDHHGVKPTSKRRKRSTVIKMIGEVQLHKNIHTLYKQIQYLAQNLELWETHSD